MTTDQVGGVDTGGGGLSADGDRVVISHAAARLTLDVNEIGKLGDGINSMDADQTIREQRQHQLQPLDVFIKHVTQQQLELQQRDRRASLPADVIELPTLSGVVMRRKQQLQLRYQQQDQQQQQAKQLQTQQLSANITTKGGRPLSISSISSAASSGSSSSAHSSASSGIHSSLTRNGSLNYGHEFRKQAYLASVESLNQGPQNDTQSSIEAELKRLNLSSSSNAATRAAIIAAGSQTRGFGQSPGNRISRINRSLHASLRYDKNMAYRIQLMANARALLNQSNQNNTIMNEEDHKQSLSDGRSSSISRNNSSTSSDGGHGQNHRLNHLSGSKARFMCHCRPIPSLTSSSSASQVDQASTSEKDETAMLTINKAATIDSASFQRSTATVIQHHPDCFYSKQERPPRKASSKLQPSPSSASSHSNTSSLFRDDGFEDDLNSTAGSEQATYLQHHRLSFQGKINNHRNYHHHGVALSQNSSSRAGDDEEDYQSCEEEFSNSHTTASTTSNLDDCALSTTSSSVINQEHQQILDKVSLANAKQQYRKSLLLEHQQQQHLLHSQHVGQSKIQALLSTSPNLCRIGSLSPCSSANTSTNSCASINNIASNSKQTKCDDRTVNIIGHMPTRSPGYWDSNLSITQRVVTEIIETERAYVEDLEQIVTGYICYLRNVLKQQKNQYSQLIAAENKHQVPQFAATSYSNSMVKKDSTPVSALPNNNEDDDKSMLVFDDDTTSATNEIEDYDVDDPDTDISHQTKENPIQVQNSMKRHQALDQYRKACNANDGAIMTANHIKKLFSNLEDIYKFNKDLLFRLEECYLNPSSVAECFVENASGFEVYTLYCTMYPQVVSTLTELMGNQTSSQLLKERQSELNQSLPLGAYLLKPVQRILKYHILFQSLIKHTVNDDSVNERDRQLIDEAFSVMTNIACHINAMKKRHEHAIRVQEVQGLLSGWEGPDLTTLGELILEDTFKLYNRPKSSRHLFLFDNVLLITKKKRDGSLCYKGHIACSNLMLIEKIEGQPLVFNTVPFDNPKALCAFQAKSLDKKRDWCIQMKEVIIKSFEVKIPVHVRDILMSLTNNSNATSGNPKQSSESTKAIKAPNYLDRKRAKQDKKHK